MQNLWLWCARLLWVSLPITAATAIADALDGWSSAPANVAAAMLWVAWATALVALFAPRPWGLTFVRVAAPVGVMVAIVCAPSTSPGTASVAVAFTLVAAVVALSPAVAQAAGNALAYGDEVRFPLRIPLPLLLAPVPVAVVLVATGVAIGPLLLADGHLVAGVVAVVVGIPLVAFLARSLHALSRRWLVLVPAGLVVVDPLILVDPAMMRGPQLLGLTATTAAPDLDRALDLRLGTPGGVTIRLVEPLPFVRRRGRSDGAIVTTDVVLVAPTRRAALLTTAGARRLSRR
jgi:hypothetical protein